ncbi:hypothetical protein D3C78_1414530 [compost metagenome]
MPRNRDHQRSDLLIAAVGLQLFVAGRVVLYRNGLHHFDERHLPAQSRFGDTHQLAIAQDHPALLFVDGVERSANGDQQQQGNQSARNQLEWNGSNLGFQFGTRHVQSSL